MVLPFVTAPVLRIAGLGPVSRKFRQLYGSGKLFYERMVYLKKSSRDFLETGSWPEILGFLVLGICLQIQRNCCAVYDHQEKADLSKGYQNPKRKLG